MQSIPTEILDQLEIAKPTVHEPVKGLEYDREINIERARHWLLNEAPKAIEGQKGDKTTYNNAMAVRDYGISCEMCLELMAEWNETKAEPPWELTGPNSLETKVNSAYKSKRKAPEGIKSIEAMFEIEEDAPKPEVKQIFETSNQSKPERPKTRIQWLDVKNMWSGLKPTQWLIDGILPFNCFYYDFGDPGTYKTFIALDRLLCIATGIPYYGHKVVQGSVFYVAGEGQQGIGRRVVAWCKKHGFVKDTADIPFFLCNMPTQLSENKELFNLFRSIRSVSQKPAVIHFDTLARNFGPGDENSAADMSKVIQNMDMIFGSKVTRGLTHHTGHQNKNRARGSTALGAAADCAFKRLDGCAVGLQLNWCIPTPFLLARCLCCCWYTHRARFLKSKS